MSYFHEIDGPGEWHAYSAANSAVLARAEAAGLSEVALCDGYVVRFGDTAKSETVPQPPPTRMLQVNLQTQASRAVKRQGPLNAHGPGTDDEPLFGWLLRKKSGGWHRGVWQRRFYVLVPESATLFYFTKGLHARNVDKVRRGDRDAPAAKGTVVLKNAMLLSQVEGQHHAWTIIVPGGEYLLAAHSEDLKEQWLAQLNAVARGEALPSSPGRAAAMPAAAPAAPPAYRPPPAAEPQPPAYHPPTSEPQPPAYHAQPAAEPPAAMTYTQQQLSAATAQALRPAPPPRPVSGAFGATPASAFSAATSGPAAPASDPFAAFDDLHLGQQPSQSDGPAAAARPALPPRQASGPAATPQPALPPRQASLPMPAAPQVLPMTAAPQLLAAAPQLDGGGRASWSRQESVGAALCGGGAAAMEHSECAVCFDELHARPAGVLVNAAQKRLCKHIVHLDCLRDLPNQPCPACPLCRRAGGGVVALPSIFEDPRRWFDLLDIDGSGLVDADDVLAALKAQLRVDEHELDEHWDELWTKFDLDGSGRLSFSELVEPERGLLSFLYKFVKASADEAAAALPASDAPPDRASPPLPPRDDYGAVGPVSGPDITTSREDWFDFWDEDGSGALDESEILRAMVHSFNMRGQRAQVRATTELVRSVLIACDVDGSSGISREEFLLPRVGLADVIIANLAAFLQDRAAVSEAPALPPRASPSPVRGWHVTVRTNGGQEYSSADFGAVEASTTVGNLRRLVAAMQPGGPSAERVKLIHRGSALRDNDSTLQNAGVRDGDTCILVMMAARQSLNFSADGSYVPPDSANPFGDAPPAYGGAPLPAYAPPSSTYGTPAPSYDAPPSYDRPPAYGPPGGEPAMARCRVTVPANAGPGSVMTVRAPMGETCRITVPPGCRAGSTFEFQYSAAPARPQYATQQSQPPARPQYTTQQSHAPYTPQQSHAPQSPFFPPASPANSHGGGFGGAAAAQLTRVVVPPGVQPGATLTVNVPGKGHFQIKVPEGVRPGTAFEFRVP
ncbi:hypothetical protein M885DRAFT_489105 [Pelagophyceae sp. CCMP2097]|nr:hypothetical protein M885DRAFT_489105 [Pelagophyceae sp. CCMP2097]